MLSFGHVPDVRRRLDAEMLRRGIVASRAEAAAAIRSGLVAVAGRPAAKASTMVLHSEPITLRAPARRFVSRGGEKLDAAIDAFGIDVADRRALDAGASTGGFTDCLLQRGAAHVVAVDVGYGQIDWRLRGDPRVTVIERTNVRELAPDRLPYRPALLTADLSFISLALVLPALARCAAPGADVVALVKPQFEAGVDDVGHGGVVGDPTVWRRVLGDVAAAASRSGLAPRAVMASPLLGPAGNAEFLLHAVAAPATGRDRGSELAAPAIDEAVAAASALAARRRGLR